MRYTILLCALLTAARDGQAQTAAALLKQFKDPPKTYTVRPFWFWNGPSATFTVSPTSKVTFGFTLSSRSRNKASPVRTASYLWLMS